MSHAMNDFLHVTPALRVHAGPQCLRQLPRDLSRLGASRAVIVCGSTLGRAGSPLDLIRDALGERLAGVFDRTKAHSPVPSVADAADFLRSVDADAVIAVGGGSAIVTARAASILLAEAADPAQLCTTFRDGKLTSPRLDAPKLPQIVIPTTPTTAIAKAGSALLDPETQSRLALYDPKTRAQSVFMHPALLGSAPRGLAVSASLNTLAMAIEGLMSAKGDPIADGQLMHALRLCASTLGDAASLDEPEARERLAIAALLCGQGTDHSGAGMTTVLGHAIGSRYDIENGVVNAVVLSHAVHFNAEAAQPGLRKIADAFGLGVADPASISDRLHSLFRALDIPSGLGDLGLIRTGLPSIAEHAMGDWFLGGNPKPIREAAELVAFMEKAW